MEFIRAEEGHIMQNGENCTATEYSTSSKSINIAQVKISDRFPEIGVMWNTKVEEMAYVESGEGIVSINGMSQSIKQGDVILYERHEKVFWDGELTLVIACSPAWTPKQHVTE